MFGRKADLRVEGDGRLVVAGSASEPVTFASASQDPQPGDWNRVVFASDQANQLSHLLVRHGGGNRRQGAITVTKSGAVSIEYATFADNLVCDIKNNGGLQATQVDFVGCP